jgi:murein DD-endopeptidase MepM/ murein hydrolase activator NlpD
VNGVALEVRTVDLYDRATDNPARRGGRSVSILGDDGVRYYFAHFESIHAAVVVGARLGIGQTLGTVGSAGRSSACHLHFGISPPCPDKEWSVRRGVIWPHLYLNAWKLSQQLSPASEIATWLANNPGACAQASADPFAPDA